MEEVIVEADARRVRPDEWSVHWPLVSAELDTIEQHWRPYWTKDYINQSVMLDRWQAWGFGDADNIYIMLLSQLMDYPGSRILQIMLAFGNRLEELAPLMEATFERFASETGCDYCEFFGRAGWGKKFTRFEKVGVIYRCKVYKIGVQ